MPGIFMCFLAHHDRTHGGGECDGVTGQDSGWASGVGQFRQTKVLPHLIEQSPSLRIGHLPFLVEQAFEDLLLLDEFAVSLQLEDRVVS